MKESIILIGGGDHCKSVIDVIEQESKFEIAGIIDLKEKIGQKVFDYSIIGSDEDIPKLSKDYSNFFITVGHIKDVSVRKTIFFNLKNIGLTPPTIISPLAYVSRYAKIGEGSIIFPFSIIDIETNIGNNCIINHATTIGHGAIIEDHCHVSANCVLGNCIIQAGTFIGVNCWINNGVSIASNSVIGSSSNVLKSIEHSGIYAGNPARELK